MKWWSDQFRSSGWKSSSSARDHIGGYTSWIFGDFEVHLYLVGVFLVHYHPDGHESKAVARSQWNLENAFPNEMSLFFSAMMNPRKLPVCIGLSYAGPIIEAWCLRH